MDGPTYTKMREGLRLQAYPDRGGNQAIGYGHNSPEITPGTIWTLAQCEAAFDQDYAIATSGAEQLIGSIWDSLGPIRQAAVVDMVFEMGVGGVAKFHHMISAIQSCDWNSAANSVMASAYASEVHARASGTAEMLEFAQWPDGFQ